MKFQTMLNEIITNTIGKYKLHFDVRHDYDTFNNNDNKIQDENSRTSLLDQQSSFKLKPGYCYQT